MKGMLETLIDICTDTFYEVKGEYIERMKKLRKEDKFEEFSDPDDLTRSLEEP